MTDAATTPRSGEDTTKTNGNDAASPPGEAAPRSKAKAAQAEVKAEPKKVDFKGLQIVLPPKMSGTVALDYAEIEDGKKSISPVVNLIRSIIGHEQYNEVYEKISESEDITTDNIVDVLTDFLDDLFAAYGSEVGELSASDDS